MNNFPENFSTIYKLIVNIGYSKVQYFAAIKAIAEFKEKYGEDDFSKIGVNTIDNETYIDTFDEIYRFHCTHYKYDLMYDYGNIHNITLLINTDPEKEILEGSNNGSSYYEGSGYYTSSSKCYNYNKNNKNMNIDIHIYFDIELYNSKNRYVDIDRDIDNIEYGDVKKYASDFSLVVKDSFNINNHKNTTHYLDNNVEKYISDVEFDIFNEQELTSGIDEILNNFIIDESNILSIDKDRYIVEEKYKGKIDTKTVRYNYSSFFTKTTGCVPQVLNLLSDQEMQDDVLNVLLDYKDMDPITVEIMKDKNFSTIITDSVTNEKYKLHFIYGGYELEKIVNA